MFASSLDDDVTREERIVTEMLRRRVDALILTTVRKNQSSLVPEQARGTVLVFVDREPAGIEADIVVTNNAEAAARRPRTSSRAGTASSPISATGANSGPRRSADVDSSSSSAPVGIPTRDIPIIEELHSEDAAYEARSALLRGRDRPTAIFASQNLVTIGVLRALRELDLQRTIALVGFDDIPLGDMLEPGVTVVAQNPYEMGRRAAELAFARLDGRLVAAAQARHPAAG